MKNKIDLFLDSGAFSAWSKNVDIDIQEYIKFIKENEKYISVYANLDVINDAEGTLKNQRIMEEAGLNPLPCFHYGDDIKYLKEYLDYDYLALGGMVPISSKDLAVWLDDLFSNHLTDKTGMPVCKIHGFGMTSLKLMMRYPWYSVDSTSWVMAARTGVIYVPRIKNGGYIYDENCWKVSISEKSPNMKEEGKHFTTLSASKQDLIKGYVEDKGYKLEELASDYKKRDEINIIYYLDLEKTMPKWPWKFKLKSNSGFGL